MQERQTAEAGADSDASPGVVEDAEPGADRREDLLGEGTGIRGVGGVLLVAPAGPDQRGVEGRDRAIVDAAVEVCQKARMHRVLRPVVDDEQGELVVAGVTCAGPQGDLEAATQPVRPDPDLAR